MSVLNSLFRLATDRSGPCVLLLIMVSFVGSGTAAQDRNAFGHELFDQTREVELALSAAPVAVARGAAVWALKSDGFTKVKEGSNGFNCMIQRANDVRIIAPTCFDAAASETIMQGQLFQARLWASGTSAESVVAQVAAAYRNGELRPPTRGSVGYMLSSEQFLGEGVGNWYPHMMIYTPYVKAADIGADLTDPKNPVHVLNPGRPDARIVIVVPDFVHPGEVSAASPTGSR